MFRFTGLVREPFFLFLIVGAIILVADQIGGRGDDVSGAATVRPSEPDSVRVTESLLEQLREQFTVRYERQPDATETERLLRGWIADEVVFREAVAAQVHHTDARIRSMIIDRMRSRWANVPGEPDEEILLAYYMENIGRYYSQPQTSFEQVFFEAPPGEPAGLLAALRRGETVSGDDFWLGDQLENYSERILRNSFGDAFYRAISDLAQGQWHGPLASARGFHFVRVLDSRPSVPLDYIDIRERVAEDWAQNQRTADIAKQTRAALREYTVVREAGP
ncbi:MAG: peptidyl-prolyl cis-trans isomerase [Chromatocurvus sp.]